MATIRILNPGVYTTVQDLGRFGFQQFGMPVSGAMDSFSLKVANMLVGNQPNAACLECTFIGSEIEILSDTAVAIAGGEASFKINDQDVCLFHNHLIKKGDIIKVGNIIKGSRIYLAFAGGIDVPEVVNSRSTYTRASIGGFNGRTLKIGDEIKVFNPTNKYSKRKLKHLLLPQWHNVQTIRVIGGSEVNLFHFEGVKTFLTTQYTISNQSDRMGYRLDGTTIMHKESADIISSGICNGAIQVPGNGKPIIMLADRQTVGGYTKIANAITADLPILGQMKPGDKINFEQVHLSTAHQLLKEQEKILQTIIK